MPLTDQKTNKTMPPLLPDIIPRPRLFKLLEHGQHYSVSWLSGPAGSGKTTLVADFLQSKHLDYIWYRLDEQDNDFSVFYTNLGQTLRQIRLKGKAKIQLPEAAFGMRPLELSRRFFETLCQRITTPFYLVLDNYQDLHKDAHFHDLLKEGISRLMPWIRLIVISREDPPKTYATLLANNQLQLINGSNDLSFSLDEAAALIRRETHAEWAEEFLTDIHAKTGGWATGLILIAKGLYVLKNELLDLKDLPLARIYDYFAVELLDRADKEIRNFLLQMALLPRIIPEIAGTVSRRSQAEKWLNSLFKHHYFIERYGAQPAFYRFHPLFHEFLLLQAHQAFSKQEIGRIRLHAAALFEERGLLSEAVMLHQQARRLDNVGKIILTHAGDMIRRGRNKTVAEWIGYLPEKIIQREPWLNYWRGVAQKFEPAAKPKKYFRKAFDQFHRARETDGTLMAWAGAVESIGNEWGSWRELDFYLAWFDRHVRPDFKFSSTQIEAPVVAAALTLMLMRRLQHPDLEHWIERALTLSASMRDVSLKVFVTAVTMIVLLYKEAPLEKIESLRVDLAQAAAGQESDSIACYRAYIEPLSFFWRDLAPEAALEIVTQTIQTTQKAEIHFLDEYVFGLGVICSLILDDFHKAQESLLLFENSLKRFKRHEVFSMYCYMKSLFHAARRETAPALEYGYRAEEATRASGFVLSHVIGLLNLGGLLILSQKYTEAGQSIAAAQKLSVKLKSPILQYQADLFKAYLWLRQGRKSAGLRALRLALADGRRYGFIRFVWWWNRDVITHICRFGLENDMEPDFIRRMIRAYRLQPDATRPETDNWFWPVEVETLGHFRLKVDGRYLSDRKKAKVVQLEMLKILTAAAPKPVPVEKIMEYLWPDKTRTQALSAFSSTLNRLRVSLGSKEAVRLTRRKVGLDSAYCRVDAQSFERLLDQACHSAREDAREGSHLYEKALKLYQGHFLEGEAEKNWILEKQAALKLKYLKAVMALGARYERDRKWEQAMLLYRQALVLEPAEEKLYCGLRACQIGLNRQDAASKSCLRCKKTLVDSGRAFAKRTDQACHRLTGTAPMKKKTSKP